MQRLIRSIVVLVSICAGSVSATPLIGEVKVFDSLGTNIVGPSLPITGDLDMTSNTHERGPFPIFRGLMDYAIN
jgi:hypothetical protein